VYLYITVSSIDGEGPAGSLLYARGSIPRFDLLTTMEQRAIVDDLGCSQTIIKPGRPSSHLSVSGSYTYVVQKHR